MANRNYPKIVTATTLIPFDNPVTSIPPKTITGVTAFTKYTTNAQAGYGAIIRVIANGSNVPDLTAFKKIGSGSYDNTNGVVNQLWFIFDGTDYCVSITQPTTIGGGGGGGDVTPPSAVSVSVEDAEPNKVLIAYGETLDAGSIPATSAYTVKVNGSTRTVSAVNISGSNVKVTFGGSPVVISDSVTLDYVVPGSNPIQDSAGNDAAALTGVIVSNNVGVTLTDIDFTSVTTLTESPSNVWNGTAASPSYANKGLATLFLDSADDGFIECQYVAVDAESAVFGLSSTNAQNPYTSIQAGMSIYAGDIYKDDNGTVSNTGVTISTGSWLRLRVTGSAIKIQKSTDHTSWTDVVTLGYTRTTDLYIVCNIDGLNKIYNPKGFNLS
jgi:hypothetical protein